MDYEFYQVLNVQYGMYVNIAWFQVAVHVN